MSSILDPRGWLARWRSRKLEKTFCVHPFAVLNLTPTGTAKPCCAFAGQLDEGGRPMSVYESSVDEIWNSESLRELRRAMVEGRTAAGCDYCFAQERRGFESMRQRSGARLAEIGETAGKLAAASARNGYRETARPKALDLHMGNLCNLKCRMCHGQSSSAIAADPVHSRWAPSGVGPARWRAGEAVIAPEPVLGVEYEGIGRPEEKSSTAWTDREAAIRVDTSKFEVSGLSIRISAEKPDAHPLRVTANGETLFEGRLPAGAWSADFDLARFARAPRLELRLFTEGFVRPGGSSAGIGLDEVRLRRKDARTTAVSFSRFDAGAEWWREKDFLYGELLKDSKDLQAIHLIGGEPLLIKEVREVMRFLADNGSAPNIGLYMTTNGTQVSGEWLALAERFRFVDVAVSVDGFGAVHEYIRHPARWDDLQANLARLRALPNGNVYCHATVQAYNMLFLPELARHCDELGVELRHHALEFPACLDMLAMPHKVRQEAARRLRDYQRTSKGRNKDSFAPVAAALETAAGEKPELVRELMVFTNDLDASRGQDLDASLPGLRELIAASGYPWVSERRFA